MSFENPNPTITSENVNGLTITFSKPKPELTVDRFRWQNGKAQAQRILRHAGLGEYKVKPKTLKSVIHDTSKDYYNYCVAHAQGNQKVGNYNSFISTLFQGFLNELFGLPHNLFWNDLEIRKVQTVLRKNPDLEKEIFGLFTTFKTSDEGIEIGSQVIKEGFDELHKCIKETSAKRLHNYVTNKNWNRTRFINARKNYNPQPRPKNFAK